MAYDKKGKGGRRLIKQKVVEPLFSVIVANYNNGRFLDVLVDSMFEQTYQNWELLIADDCSTDDSLKYIKQQAARDARIKWVAHEINQGAGATFKSAADISSGDIIGMLGADDALTKTALEIMVKAHEEYPEASMITSQSIDCDEEMTPIGLCDISGEQPRGVSFIREIHIGNFVTFKRKAYEKTTGFDPAMRRAVDHDIFLKLEEVGTLAFVETPVYLYRRHLSGISQGGNGTRAANFSMKAKLNAYHRRQRTGYPHNLSAEEFRGLSALYHQRYAYYCILDKKYGQAFRSNFKVLSYKPDHILQRNFWTTLIKSTIGRVAN